MDCPFEYGGMLSLVGSCFTAVQEGMGMISSEVLVVLLWRAGHPRLKTAWGLDSLKLSLPCYECRNPARPRLQSYCLLPHGQRCVLKS
jgi:hypothetical protein